MKKIKQVTFYLYRSSDEFFYYELFIGNELINFEFDSEEKSTANLMMIALLKHITKFLKGENHELVCSIKKGIISDSVDFILVPDDSDSILCQENKYSKISTESFDLITKYFLKLTSKPKHELLLEFKEELS